MTQIQDPGQSALELRFRGKTERLPLGMVREACGALDAAHVDLRATLCEWLAEGGEQDVPIEDLTVYAQQLAAAAHDGESEAGGLARLLPSSSGKIVGISDDGQVPISALVVLALALQRFSLLAGLGARLVRPARVQ